MNALAPTPARHTLTAAVATPAQIEGVGEGVRRKEGDVVLHVVLLCVVCAVVCCCVLYVLLCVVVCCMCCCVLLCVVCAVVCCCVLYVLLYVVVCTSMTEGKEGQQRILLS